MRIQIKHDLKQIKRRIGRIHARQVPFAASQAMNACAFDIRRSIDPLWRRSVRVKQRSLIRAAFRVKTSTKRRLRAEVYDRLNLALFPRQIKGGLRIPYSSTHLAIPTYNALTPTGKIKKAARIGGKDSKLFKMKLRRQDPGLFLRTSRGLKLMYVLKRKAVVDKSFPLFEMADRVVKQRYGKYFDRHLRRAIRTAR